MDHLNLDKTTSSTLMLPKDEKEKVVIVTGNPTIGRLLIREDTVLTNLQGCAGCGRAQFTCAGVKKQWSVLCWGKQSDKKYYTLLVALSATFGLSLIGTIFFCFTNTLNNAILSNMVIRNNSLAYSMWRRPTVHPLMKVHIFNYTNWQRVRDRMDDKLHVEDVGPYVYSQQLERVNIKFDGDQLTYQERMNFKFLPDQSVGAHFDKIFVPNLPLIGVISKAVHQPLLVQMALDSALSFTNHHDAFLELPVQRFLWGYDDDIIDVAKPFLSFLGKLNFEKFGLLVTKNGTVSDVLTINTGDRDKQKMNLIQKLNGHAHLNYWGSPECNRIDSSDGTIFPPALLTDKNTTLYVLYTNLCRRLPFEYMKDVEEDGIPLYRYKMPADVFDDPDSNPSNQCFCEIDSGTCPPRGVINVTACAMGAPALASFPHFFRGDPMLRMNVTGLEPDESRHDSFIDIHPTLGIALSGRSSMQINIQVKKSGTFGSTHYLDEGLILPVAWIEMSVEHLPDSLRSLVYHGTYSTAAAQLGLIAMCIITLVVSGTCLFIMLVVRKQRKPCAKVKVLPVDNESKAQLSR